MNKQQKPKRKSKPIQCEGWRRYGGVFTFGPVRWEQCKNDAVVMLTVIQEKRQTLPACMTCWEECANNGMRILKAVPITTYKEDEQQKTKKKSK